MTDELLIVFVHDSRNEFDHVRTDETTIRMRGSGYVSSL